MSRGDHSCTARTDRARSVAGRIVEDLKLEPLAGVVERARGLDGSLGDVWLVEHGELHRHRREQLEGQGGARRSSRARDAAGQPEPMKPVRTHRARCEAIDERQDARWGNCVDHVAKVESRTRAVRNRDVTGSHRPEEVPRDQEHRICVAQLKPRVQHARGVDAIEPQNTNRAAQMVPHEQVPGRP